MTVTTNCIIDGMDNDVYHSDPTPLKSDAFKEYTSLSSGVALAIIEKTEKEARREIRRFNPDKKQKANSDAVNLGSILHDKVLLGDKGNPPFEVVPFGDFKTKAAQNARDDLIDRGVIPLAQNKKTEALLSNIDIMEQRLHEQLARHKDFPGVMQKGVGEQSGFYFDETLGIWNRARFDWLDDVYPGIVWDYKTTALPVDKWINQQLWSEKYIQCPHYMDVFSGVTGEKCKFAFVVQQTVDPFFVQIVVIDESFMGEVRKRYDIAKNRFVNCLRTGIWRGVSPYTIHACPPPWVLNRWEMDELNEDTVSKIEKCEKEEDPARYIYAG